VFTSGYDVEFRRVGSWWAGDNFDPGAERLRNLGPTPLPMWPLPSETRAEFVFVGLWFWGGGPVLVGGALPFAQMVGAGKPDRAAVWR